MLFIRRELERELEDLERQDAITGLRRLRAAISQRWPTSERQFSICRYHPFEYGVTQRMRVA